MFPRSAAAQQCHLRNLRGGGGEEAAGGGPGRVRKRSARCFLRFPRRWRRKRRWPDFSYLSLLCLQPSVYTRPHLPVADGNLRPPANTDTSPTAVPEEDDNSFKEVEISAADQTSSIRLVQTPGQVSPGCCCTLSFAVYHFESSPSEWPIGGHMTQKDIRGRFQVANMLKKN